VPSAIATEKELRQEELRGVRTALMHGRMAAKERDAVMRRFADREIDVLVATTVVEVGIDIPNATVMVVLGAERFGLAQLHQFREMFEGSSEPVGILLAAAVMVVVGAIDDVREVSPPAKVAGQVLSGSLLSLFGVTMLVSYLSQFMTLLPGDVISTGTPAGVGLGMKPNPQYLKLGDVVELGISKLGVQHHRVVEAK